MDLDELTNARFQLRNAGTPPVQGSRLQLSEPAFHRVQPRGAGRREVQLEAWMLLQPRLDRGSLVSRAVVQDHMQIQLSRCVAVDLLQESQKTPWPDDAG